MVATGSRGCTLEKMLGFLGSKNIDEINSESLEMMALTTGDEPVLCLVNGALFNQRFPPKPSYKEDVLEDIYGFEAKTVDFVTEGDKAVYEINKWAEAASRGLIRNFLQRGSLSRDIALVLANVPFMTSHNNDRHCESFDGFKVLQMPYLSNSNQFSMYFFLPDERDGLQNLLEKLVCDSGYWHQYSRLSEKRLDEFWIPKLKFSYDFDVSLTMKKMGLSFPFMENPKDFAEMVEIPEGLPFVSKTIQKAFIEVDEKGTVAGTSSMHFGVSGCCLPKRSSFVADHPFMFMIMEEGSRFVIFTGAVLDPSRVN
ncbi:hypothetical protein RHSIM_Rhsim09G0017400 [Rhododendron simsii]|uniref:Serpin domain-containing protein n=1 Tax=Rhododendron simsii TaxID=118357 RepID=A0A834GIZ1_RHOSS|nr:hypothetical protein RHSIM_Rhsim09G0017400 [Rhododendron simsii]